LIWASALPLLGSALVAAWPPRAAHRPWVGARAVALLIALGTLLLVARAAGRFDYGGGAWSVRGAAAGAVQLAGQFAGIRVGVDGLAMPLALLAAGLGVLACWGSQAVRGAGKGYYAGLLLALGAGLLAVTCVNAFIYLVSLAVLTGVMGYLVGGWGGDRRGRAARRFIVFALAGIGLLVAGLATRFGGGMFGAASDWTAGASGDGKGVGAGFWLALAGCGILLGIVPLHWWLAEAVAEAAAPVALLMVGVVNTLGGYGLIRFSRWWGEGAGSGASHEGTAWALGIAGAVGMIYGALGAWGQKDLKRMAAFLAAGVSGLVVAGLATGFGGGPAVGLEGAAHLLACRGVATGMLVVVAGMVESRVGHCEMGRLGGLGGYLPGLAAWSAVAFLGAAGMPGSGTFVGIALVVLGAFERGTAWLGVLGIAAMVALIGCAVRAYMKVFMGNPKPEHSNVARLNVPEKWMLVLLGVAVVAMGVIVF
jgi:NADH:ubiquinone oxidoreductase subunit 4 (subunit M)